MRQMPLLFMGMCNDKDTPVPCLFEAYIPVRIDRNKEKENDIKKVISDRDGKWQQESMEGGVRGAASDRHPEEVSLRRWCLVWDEKNEKEPAM